MFSFALYTISDQQSVEHNTFLSKYQLMSDIDVLTAT